nr:MAG TPA: hypothetical protein [Caudoviricetes sp.]
MQYCIYYILFASYLVSLRILNAPFKTTLLQVKRLHF